MCKAGLVDQVEKLEMILEKMQAKYYAAWDHIQSIIDTGSSYRDVLRSKPFTDLLHFVNVESEESSGENEVFTLLVMLDRQGKFVIRPGCFSSGWHGVSLEMVDKATTQRAPIPFHTGILWYGNSLFQHRPVHCLADVTPTDFTYREITAVEFLLKSLVCDLYLLLAGERSSLESRYETLKHDLVNVINKYWEMFRIPPSLLSGKKKEFEHFLRMDAETLVISISANEISGGNIAKIFSGLFKLYKKAFSCISGLGENELVNGKPSREACSYLGRLVKNTAGSKAGKTGEFLSFIIEKPPDTWLDWLLQTILLFLAHENRLLDARLRGVFDKAVKAMDVRSGPLKDALHLQNIRITPLSMITKLSGLIVSQFRYTTLHQLESNLVKRYLGLKGTVAEIDRGLRELLSFCLREIMEEEQAMVLKRRIEQQREIILEDTIQRYSHLDPGVTRDGCEGYRELLGKSTFMKDVFRKIHQVAPTNETVLITGEPGTGKKMTARAIHALSHRSNRKLVIVNCATLSREQLGSELFGRVSSVKSKLEEADGGTLLLEHVEAINSGILARVLGAMESGTYTRVKKNSIAKTDVRLIFTTCQDLKSMVEDGKFSQDAYYKVGGYQIRMHPLSERPEDIPLLVTSFILRKQAELGDFQVTRVAPEVLRRLTRCRFNNNACDLKWLITDLMVDLRGKNVDTIGPGDIEVRLEGLDVVIQPEDVRGEMDNSMNMSCSGTER